MNKLVTAWLYGYVHPNRMMAILKNENSPWIGFSATFLRGIMNSLILFLPLTLLGRIPSLPSYLTIISTQNYFMFLTMIVPFYFLMLWLFLSGVIYLILRLIIRTTPGFDHILNIFGLIGLIVGSCLILWDWMWILLGSSNYILLGISHLIIDIWAVVLATICLHNIIVLKIWASLKIFRCLVANSF